MKPLVKAQIPFSEAVAMADMLLAKPPEFFEPFLGHVPSFDEIAKFVDAQVKERMEDEIWVNDVYQVAVRPADDWTDKDRRSSWPELIHLSIKRIDRKPIHDWRDLQEIKMARRPIVLPPDDVRDPQTLS